MKRIFTYLAFTFLASAAAQAQLNNFAVGATAPNFTVTDLHGHTHNLSDYAGKWVMIDFFAYWCGPCQQTAPIINDFYKKYGCNNYDIVVLALEGDGTTAQTQTFEDQHGGDANFPTPTASGLDGGADPVHTTYGPAAYPTIVLIGPDGKFKNIDIWPISNVGSIESAFNTAGASSALVEHTCGALGTEEMTVDAASVYPNPASAGATISVTMPNSGTVEIILYSISGNLISKTTAELSGGVSKIPVNLSDLTAGTYLLQLINGETVSSMIPVVKQ